jgi:hypothetical protein
MQITIEEVGKLFDLYKAMSTTKVERYENEVYETLRRENQEFMSMIIFIKTHYPEAIEAWQAVKKIGE